MSSVHCRKQSDLYRKLCEVTACGWWCFHTSKKAHKCPPVEADSFDFSLLVGPWSRYPVPYLRDAFNLKDLGTDFIKTLNSIWINFIILGNGSHLIVINSTFHSSILHAKGGYFSLNLDPRGKCS